MPWEELENEFAHRVRDPGDFQEGSFRRIPFQRASPKVFAIIGKLKGETTTTVQALRFPKSEGWTLVKAKAWVKEHFKKSQSPVEYKELSFDLKHVAPEGTFDGLLSVYNVVDEGQDLIEPGAFSKTIADNQGQIPAFWRHEEPIGMLMLADEQNALAVHGDLVMEVRQAKEAHALMKRGVVKGLSIGYRVIKHEMDGAIRRIKEAKLFEGSIVPFPMNRYARVTAVKEEGEVDQASIELQVLQALLTEKDIATAEQQPVQDQEPQGTADEPVGDHSALNAMTAILKRGTSDIPNIREILDGTQRSN